MLDKAFFFAIIKDVMETQSINQIIKRFHNFILERDLTLKKTAILLDMSHTAVADIINGKIKKPHGRTLYKIKKLLGETVGSTSNPKRGGVASQD
jgi:transcriptional regulator with XRE-family HTH domain